MLPLIRLTNLASYDSAIPYQNFCHKHFTTKNPKPKTMFCVRNRVKQMLFTRRQYSEGTSIRSCSNPHFGDAITIFRALTSLHISVHISTIRRSIIFYGTNTRRLVEVSVRSVCALRVYFLRVYLQICFFYDDWVFCDVEIIPYRQQIASSNTNICLLLHNGGN